MADLVPAAFPKTGNWSAGEEAYRQAAGCAPG